MQTKAFACELELGGHLRFEPTWIEPSEADVFFQELRAAIEWNQGTIALFGREVREPRLTAWFGDADYTYSGRTMRAAPWPPSVPAIRSRVQLPANVPFTPVLLNLNPDVPARFRR